MNRSNPAYRTMATRFLGMLALLLWAPASGQCQGPADLPTRGREFWLGFPQNGFGAQQLRVIISSRTATTGVVSFPNTGWSQAFTVAANGSAQVVLPNAAEITGSEAVISKGVHVTAQDPVTVFMVNFQNFTSDAAQALPLDGLGITYRVEAYSGLPNFNNTYRSQLLIVATEDDTEVRITPSVNTSAGRPAGVPFTVTLNTGQCYQVQAQTDTGDLSGTLVEGTDSSGPCRPFAVFGGSMCANIPSDCQACDMIFDQLKPVEAWGTVHHTVPVHGLPFSGFRILAHQNNTVVNIDGGAPITLNAGQRHEVNTVAAGACITADKPVSVTQFLEGYFCANAGDPAMVVLSPAERLSQEVVFRTSASTQITNHSVTVVMDAAATGQLQLNGSPVAPAMFSTYPGCSSKAFARIPLTAGTHRLQAAAGFAAYVFGLGVGESYAYSVHDIAAEEEEPQALVCTDSEITLTLPEPLDGIQWTAASAPNTVVGNGQSYTFTPNANDTLVASGFIPGTQCPKSYRFPVGVLLSVPPGMSANGLPQATVCQYAPVQLALDPAPDPALFNILWSPTNSLSDPTVANPLAQPVDDTWYSVLVSSPVGCGSFNDSVWVEVLPSALYRLHASADDDAICLGGSAQLTAQAELVLHSDGFNLAPAAFWQNVQGGGVSAACGAVTGSALLFNGAGTRSAATVAMNMSTGGHVHFDLFIAGPGSACDDAQPGEDVVLEYSTNGGGTWNIAATFNEAMYPVFTAVSVQLPAAAQTANTRFRFRQLANSGAGQDVWALDNVIITSYGTAGIGFSWDPASSLNTPNVPDPLATPQVTTWYTGLATETGTGCQQQDSVLVVVQDAFFLTLTPDTAICDANGIQLSAVPSSGSGIVYSWTPADGSLSATNVPNPLATPATTTTYTVNATNDIGCTANGSVTIGVGQLAALTVTAAQDVLCQGESTQLSSTLTGAGTFSYSWSPATGLSDASVPNPVASPTSSTVYTLTVEDTQSGCALSGSVALQVNTDYSINASPDAQLCSAIGHQLTVQHNVPQPTYAWSPAANLNAANIQSPSILSNTSTTYTVTVTDANGCSVSDEVVIAVAFDDLVQPQPIGFCGGSSALLDAGYPGMTYAWSNGASTQQITVSESGNYTVTITNGQGCDAIRTFPVTVHPLPMLTLSPDQVLCGASQAVLTATSPGNSIQWSTGASGTSITVTQAGTYTAQATNNFGCTTSAGTTVSFPPLPQNNLQDVGICTGENATLNAGNAGSNFLWNTGASTQTITVSETGTYSVTVTTQDGCTADFQAQVNVTAPPVVSLGADTLICGGDQILLDAGNPGATYLWSTGATSQTISVNTAGTYTVTAAFGACEAQGSITVGIGAAPTDVLQDVSTCEGTLVTLDAGNGGATFLWSTGATTQTITVAESGTYSVGIALPNGCTASYDALVEILSYPVVALGNDTTLCEGRSIILDAGDGPGTYQWTNGSNSRNIQVNTAGTYGVVVSNGPCVSSDAVTISFSPSPARMAARQLFACLEEEPRYVVIDAGNPGSRYDWSTGENSQVILAGAYGWYFVEVTNSFDCALRDSVVVNEYCPSSIYLPNTFTPNGDGINDVFLAVGKNIASLHMIVFDRWGGVLFESDDPNIGWDGTFKGEPVKNDMYIWKIRYRFLEDQGGRTGMEQERMGHIQVLR